VSISIVKLNLLVLYVFFYDISKNPIFNFSRGSAFTKVFLKLRQSWEDYWSRNWKKIPSHLNLTRKLLSCFLYRFSRFIYLIWSIRSQRRRLKRNPRSGKISESHQTALTQNQIHVIYPSWTFVDFRFTKWGTTLSCVTLIYLRGSSYWSIITKNLIRSHRIFKYFYFHIINLIILFMNVYVGNLKHNNKLALINLIIFMNKVTVFKKGKKILNLEQGGNLYFLSEALWINFELFSLNYIN